jgi:ribonuclease G
MASKSTIVVSVDVGETRVALIENGILSEIFVERERDRSPVGNIYLGKVTRVLPGMQAAFVDIGLDRAAFLHVEDVIPQEDFDKLLSGEEEGGEEEDKEEKEGKEDRDRDANRLSRKTPIRDVLKEGQTIVVQVSKGPISTKGARVTSHVSLPGRFVVYMPTVDHIGVSKRIGNDKERKRLREVIEAHEALARRAHRPHRRAGPDEGHAQGRHRLPGQDLGDGGAAAEDRQARAAAPLLPSSTSCSARHATSSRRTSPRSSSTIATSTRRLKQFVESFMPERAGDVELYDGADPDLRRVRHRGRDRAIALAEGAAAERAATSSSIRPRRSRPSTSTPAASRARARTSKRPSSRPTSRRPRRSATSCASATSVGSSSSTSSTWSGRNHREKVYKALDQPSQG